MFIVCGEALFDVFATGNTPTGIGFDGRITLGPFVETRPMSQIAQVFDEAHHGKLKKRVILTPDF